MATRAAQDRPAAVRTTLIVGMEVHVQLATRTKMFTRAPNPAHPDAADPEPNTLIDPVVLGLPGALPVPNREAVELSIRVGLALGCSIADETKWDRKSYFYPDLPKNYQISQYDLPLCSGGVIELPRSTEHAEPTRVRIVRAHLEEDAGKLLHEWPGGRAIDHSIVDYNRAGAPLLEIVTAPDLTSADDAVAFAQTLRRVCRAVGATEGVMQRGHMRFEPNINCTLELEDGTVVTTPIVEVKNLNSFRALHGAIEYERANQERRWRETGRTFGAGTKSTRGWDDRRGVTTLQREKEEADAYRYFPDPDLLPVVIDRAEVERARASLPELPHARAARFAREFGLGPQETEVLAEEFGSAELIGAALDALPPEPPEPPEPPHRAAAGRIIANLVLQCGFRLANERGVPAHELGVTAAQLAGIAALRAAGDINAAQADALLEHLCGVDDDAAAAAAALGLLQVRDESALARWVDDALADPANAQAVADLKAGRQQAAGRLIGAVMRSSSGQADAKAVRAMIAQRTAAG